MTMTIRSVAAALAAIGMAAPAVAQQPKGAPADSPAPAAIRPDRPAPRPVEGPTELELTPAPAPTPLLKHRLMPLESERTPGNAAPVYLRIGADLGSEALDAINKNHAQWIEVPLDAFPAPEAREFVDQFSGRLDLIRLGTRRQECDWGYTLPEQREDAIEILLPDAQEMRTWARLIQLKARLEIAEGKFGEAVETLETALAFGRHVGQGPFLINALVGSAIQGVMLGELEHLIGRPDAPNLYWAIATVPAIPISYRGALANEAKLVEWMVPALTELDAPRTEAEWSARLIELHRQLVRLGSKLGYLDGQAIPNPLEGVSVEDLRAELLPEARTFLEERRGSIEGLTDDQMVVLYVAGRYREARDAVFAPMYLPYDQARTLYDAPEFEAPIEALKGGLLRLFTEMTPALRAARAAEIRIARRLAGLRTIEAIRMHAAANGGKLPGSLDEVTVVPIPTDPATGGPFAYRLDGDAALLSAPDLGVPKNGFSYRLTLRGR